MRFYYQSQDDDSDQKVSTKCIRVSSTATTKDVIETLIEKFRPGMTQDDQNLFLKDWKPSLCLPADLKMLEIPKYNLYEIHESGERNLAADEKPLHVQVWLQKFQTSNEDIFETPKNFLLIEIQISIWLKIL
jgi:afadin